MNDLMVTFLNTGQFQDISFGRSIADVSKSLGEPDYSVVSDMVLLHKYQSLELQFINDVIVDIKLGFDSGVLEMPNKYNFSSKWSKKNVLDWADLLNDCDVAYRICPDKSHDDWLCLITEGGVCIYTELFRKLVDRVQANKSEISLFHCQP